MPSSRSLFITSTSPLERISEEEKLSIVCTSPSHSDSTSSTPDRSPSPDSSYSDEPFLESFHSSSPASLSILRPRPGSISGHARYARRLLSTKRWNSRLMASILCTLALCAFLWTEDSARDPQRTMMAVREAADALRQRQCRLLPRLKRCPDPFRRLKYEDENGLLVYPAKLADPSSSPSLSSSPPPPPQPHPIHYLIQSAETVWNAKVARQSTNLEAAVSEYRRRYGQAPPRGFDAWYNFATKNNVSLIDEYDSIFRNILPYAALSPEVLQKRSAMLQNTTGEEQFWLHQHSVTVEIRENGEKVTADGPMRKVNHRADQLLLLLKDISQFLPDLNVTITGEHSSLSLYSCQS